MENYGFCGPLTLVTLVQSIRSFYFSDVGLIYCGKSRYIDFVSMFRDMMQLTQCQQTEQFIVSVSKWIILCCRYYVLSAVVCITRCLNTWCMLIMEFRNTVDTWFFAAPFFNFWNNNLQISEVVNGMKDLIDYSRETGTGPMGKFLLQCW